MENVSLSMQHEGETRGTSIDVPRRKHCPKCTSKDQGTRQRLNTGGGYIIHDRMTLQKRKAR